MVLIGLERLLREETWKAKLKDKRIGLLSSHASTDRNFLYTKDLVFEAFKDQFTCLFSPQHGFFAEKQDNMIESDHSMDEDQQIPIYSLYGETRKPTKEMYDDLDVLLIDIVDVGTRVYTFMYTMAYCLEAAKEHGKKVVVLDRPNPIGGDQVEGNLLKTEVKSFVGLFPIPMRHGLTFAELALLMNEAFGIDADLEIIRMKGWQRGMYFEDTGYPWVFPSPNMPTVETAVVYPGQVIWEGTNVSEGRGTTKPFELIGAPFVDHQKVTQYLEKTELPGCVLRPVVFEPTSGKWQGQPCNGFYLHVTDRHLYLPYRTSLALLQAIMLGSSGNFSYKEPPYEYEFEKLPMDLILGDPEVRIKIEQGQSIQKIEEQWMPELEGFIELRKSIFYTNKREEKMDNKTISLSQIAEMVGGEVVGDKEMIISGFSSLELAQQGEISFIAKVGKTDLAELTKASAVLAPMNQENEGLPLVKVKDPYLASAIVHNYFLEKPFIGHGVHPRAYIGESCEIAEEITIKANATIGDRVKIGARTTVEPGVVIGDDVIIGEECVIKANVTIAENCSVGNRVTIHSGTVIGSDGFGYAADARGCHIKRPQVGTVIIGDDVEIGANCSVDRATFGVTEIKSGAKLDNQVQLGHNVIVGENSIIVAQVGIAGSVTLGRNVVLGGQAGLSGHITLEDGVMVAAKGGVHTDLPKGSVVGGAPAMPIRQWGKTSAVIAKLPELRKEIRNLKKEVEALKNNK